MRCTEPRDDLPPAHPLTGVARGTARATMPLLTLLLSGCLGGGLPRADAPASPAGTAAAADGRPAAGRVPAAEPARVPAPVVGGAPPAPRLTVVRPPMPARPARNAAEYQRQMAQHLTAALPGLSYASRTPDVLLAIPVLSVELNADGSVRAVDVLRRPGQALDTLQMAIDAVRAAAPYPPVGHLPRPWKFNQVFLYNDQRLFKLQVLDVR
ncbi:MAG: hypothetical protein RLY78_1846 [Pseudomonadota bacterium]|uniref:Energy transducer TonB n=1 Tax=Pseudaquabacterium rugosum TaxID=2984194 RepID=A0ABU9B607_9BURK